METSECHRDNFNLIRLLLATGVVVSHSFGVIGRSEPSVMLHSLGNLSVHGFFFVSGYMITQSFQRLSLGAFLAHRFLRIAPALAVAVPFSFWLASQFGYFAGNPLHLVNGVVWTIPWEVACYLLCAGFGLIGVLDSGRFSVLFGSMLLVAFANADFHSDSYVVLCPLFLLFATGAFFALNPDIPVKTLAPIAFLIAMLVHFEPKTHWLSGVLAQIPFVYAPKSSVGLPIVLELAHLFSVSILLMWFGRCVRPLWNTSVDLSYGVYLYAFPLQQMIVALTMQAGLPLTVGGVFFPSMLLAVIMAAGSWFLIEKPALQLKRLKMHAAMPNVLGHKASQLNAHSYRAQAEHSLSSVVHLPTGKWTPCNVRPAGLTTARRGGDDRSDPCVFLGDDRCDCT